MTRDNVTKRLALAVAAAAKLNAGLENRRITPHTVRHTTAMNLLQSRVDISVIALWLGHENPLYDLASVLLARGEDPLRRSARLTEELPAHHPLHDARQSARLFLDALETPNHCSG